MLEIQFKELEFKITVLSSSELFSGNHPWKDICIPRGSQGQKAGKIVCVSGSGLLEGSSCVSL